MARGGSGGNRRRRLSRSGDFKRAYREGRSKGSRFLVVYEFPRSAEGGEGEATDERDSRLGVSVSRKIGDAVTRNRVKRVLKEAFWAVRTGSEDPRASDFVLVARPGIEDLIESEGTSGIEPLIGELLSGDSASNEGGEDENGAGDTGE